MPKKATRTPQTVFETFREVLDILDVLHASQIGYIFSDIRTSTGVSISLTEVAYKKASKLLPHIFTGEAIGKYGITLEWKMKDEGSMEWRLAHQTERGVS